MQEDPACGAQSLEVLVGGSGEKKNKLSFRVTEIIQFEETAG